MRQRSHLFFSFAILISFCCTALEAQHRTDIYLQHNLVSDLRAHTEITDPNLVNAWGISFAPTGPFWISDNHTGLVTVYNGEGRPFPSDHPLVVTVPPPTNG